MPRRTTSRAAAARDALSEAWAHRSFIWLLASRLFILMGAGTLAAEANWFLTRSLGYSNEETATAFLVLLAITVASAAIVAGWAGHASDRYGRRPMIWVGCAISAAGMAILALGPAQPEILVGPVRFPLAGLGAVPVGIGVGMFLSVDWALMVDIIPKATAGRYMGISNVVTATSGAIAGLVGAEIISQGTRASGDPGLGPRLAFLAALAYFAIGAWALRRVDTQPFEVQMAGRPGVASAANAAPVGP